MDSEQPKSTKHLPLSVCFELCWVAPRCVRDTIPSLEEGSFVIETEATGENLIDVCSKQQAAKLMNLLGIWLRCRLRLRGGTEWRHAEAFLSPRSC